MSHSVSQLPYWTQGPANNSANAAQKEGGEGAAYLSYDAFMGLSILGGFLGLDHLYLRSPLTFLAKIIVNVLFFGVWWLYDASQAFFHADTLKVFGLGVPGLGPRGIAAGVLSKEVPDKKHWRFFIYSFALMFGGIFGLDSFILGENWTGVFRLISLLSVIFAPIAAVIYGYNLYQYFFNTQDIIQSNHEFFGAVEQSASSKMQSRFPFLSDFFNPLETLKNLFRSIVSPVVGPIATSIDKAAASVDGVVSLASLTLEKGSEIVGEISNVVQQASQASSMIPGVSLYSGVTPAAVSAAKSALVSGSPATGVSGSPAAGVSGSPATEVQKGGARNTSTAGLNVVPYTLLGTIAVIVASGFGLTYYRSRKDVSGFQQRDDSPPEPGVSRKSNSKGGKA